MPKTKATTLDPEPEVQEQPAETPAEAEAVEQRGDETPQFPELPEEVTFQHLQQHPKFKEDWDNLTRTQQEERSKAYRDGQAAASKEFDANKRKWGVEQQALAIFDHWERKRLSDDPYETQEFAKAIDRPEVRAAYDQGQAIRRGPSSQDIAERAQFEIMSNVDTHLDEKLSKQGALSDDEKGRIDKAKFKTIGELTAAKVDLAIERGIAAGRKKDDAKSLQEAKEEGRREAYDEAGLEYPGEPVEGRKAPKPGSAQDLRKQYADGDIDTATYNKKMAALGASP